MKNGVDNRFMATNGPKFEAVAMYTKILTRYQEKVIAAQTND